MRESVICPGSGLLGATLCHKLWENDLLLSQAAVTTRQSRHFPGAHLLTTCDTCSAGFCVQAHLDGGSPGNSSSLFSALCWWHASFPRAQVLRSRVSNRACSRIRCRVVLLDHDLTKLEDAVLVSVRSWLHA